MNDNNIYRVVYTYGESILDKHKYFFKIYWTVYFFLYPKILLVELNKILIYIYKNTSNHARNVTHI